MPSDSVLSQSYFTRNFELDDGLPFKECIRLLSDTDGSLWIFSPTDELCRFNGRTFENYNVEDTGIPHFIHYCQANNNGIWLINNKKVSRFEKGTWSVYGHETSYDAVGFLNDVPVAYRKDFSYSVFDKDTNRFGPYINVKVPKHIKEHPDMSSFYFISPDKIIVNYNRRDIGHYYKILRQTSGLYEVQDSFNNCHLINLVSGEILIVHENDGKIKIWKEGKLITINTINHPSLNNINSVRVLFADKNYGDQYIHFLLTPGELNKSSYFVVLDRHSYKIAKVIPIDQVSILHYHVDILGNLWIAGHFGLQKFNCAITEFLPVNSGIVPSLSSINENEDGSIIFAGYKSGLTEFNGHEFHNTIFSKLERNSFLPGTFKNKKGELFFMCEGGEILQLKNGKSTFLSLYEEEERLISSGYFIDSLASGQMVLGLNRLGLGLVRKIKGDTIIVKTIGAEKGLNLINVLTVSEDRAGRVWAGRPSTGIAAYDFVKDTAYTWERSLDNPKSLGVISSEVDSLGNLWLGSNRGLYFLKDPHKIDIARANIFDMAQHIELPNGDQSMVTTLKQYKNYLAIGNETAVNFLDLHNFYNEGKELIYSLFFGDDINGHGCEQNGAYIDSQDKLWIGIQDGAIEIDFDQLQFDTTVNKINILTARSGGKEVAINNNTICIPNDNRNYEIKLQFSGQQSLSDNIFLEKILTKQSGDTLIHERFLRSEVLEQKLIPPGNYDLHITARKNGIVIDKASLKLHVPLTLTENPLFWILLAISILLIYLGFYIIKIRQDKLLLVQDMTLNQLKNEKQHLQIQSIINSFNPHFINNSLHWAQSRYRKDPELVMLISKLSDNIRYIFRNTLQGKAVHSLKQELLLVDNYIAIQKLRFNDSFEFRLEDPEIFKQNGDIQLFIMQLQIHVENAIEHGLRNRRNSSFVELKLLDQGDHWQFIITDDGIGYQNSKNIPSSGTQSGTKMLDELYRIFNQNNEQKLSLTYQQDIFADDKGDTFGTQVIVKLPKNYSYEL